jgi:hypothetical protein
LTVARKLGMGVLALAMSVCSVGASSGIGTATDPPTRIDTTDGPAQELLVGVDIAPGLWVGTAAEPGHPGNCEVIPMQVHMPSSRVRVDDLLPADPAPAPRERYGRSESALTPALTSTSLVVCRSTEPN